MSTQEYIRSITELTPDDFPSTSVSGTSSNNGSSFFTNVSWQTWIIIFLILTLLGINVFAYLAKGTEETVSIFSKVFGPVLAFFGLSALETTKQTVETSATGTKAGVDIAAAAATGVINTVEEEAANIPISTSGTSVGITTSQKVQGKQAQSSLPKARQIETETEEWQQGALEKALEDASQRDDQGPIPNDTSIPAGKSGWCFIGEDHGMRTCSEIGVNDMCMSGDIFPTQAVCMNPKLRA